MDNSGMPLFDRMALGYEKFTKSQKRICDYLLNNLDKVVFMTVSELAASVGVSEATIIRFACTVSGNGYRGLQKELRESLQNRMTTVQRLNMLEGLTSREVIRESFSSDISNLRVTENSNSAEVLDAAVDVMDGARVLYLVGSRSSWPLVQFLEYYLRYMMSNIHVIRSEGSDVYTQTLGANSEDAAIAISFPRYSTRTIEIMEHLKTLGIRLISISDRHTSPPSLLAEFSLLARSYMASFVDSFVAPLALINVLIVKLGLKRKATLFENFEALEVLWKAHGVYAANRKGGGRE